MVCGDCCVEVFVVGFDVIGGGGGGDMFYYDF